MNIHITIYDNTFIIGKNFRPFPAVAVKSPVVAVKPEPQDSSYVFFFTKTFSPMFWKYYSRQFVRCLFCFPHHKEGSQPAGETFK